MEKQYKIITFFLSGFTILLSIFFLAFKKETFSENENRYLETFPTFSFENVENGKYMKGLESYITDHFPFRDLFVSFKTNVYKTLGFKEINQVFFAKDSYLIEKYQKPQSTEKIINNLNEFFDKLSYTNMNLMLVPTSVSIYSEKLPIYAITENQKEVIDHIYSSIHFDGVYVYSALMNKKEDYPLYYRLDHHWTSYGAYYAYLEYCRLNQIEPIPINEFDIKEVTDSFYGTLYSKTNDYSLKPDSIHRFDVKDSSYTVFYVQEKETSNSLYEDSYLEKKDKYSYFLNNNHPLIQITNNQLKNGKELVIIKDSYANSIVPFLINHYEKIHVIDPRFYKLSISSYIEENKIKDVLFLYNMNTIDTDLGILSVE